MSFHFGLPASDLLERVRAWGAKIIASATTVAEARWLEAHGVDAIIAQGVEAGGHRGMFLGPTLATQVGTFALLPQVVQAVGVPVIAAGGVASADSVAAALALGAAGVQVGTAYLLCPEATTSAVHRAALASDAAAHTALTNIFTGRPARGIVNRAHPRTRAHQLPGPGLPARNPGLDGPARPRGSGRQRRLLAALGGPECERLQRRSRPQRCCSGSPNDSEAPPKDTRWIPTLPSTCVHGSAAARRCTTSSRRPRSRR